MNFFNFLVNGIAPRKANSNIPSRRPLKPAPAENATEILEGDCPEPDGFFPNADQCDKYFECSEGKVIAEKLCPDGMVFNDFSPTHEKCDLPFNIDCSKRPKLRKYYFYSNNLRPKRRKLNYVTSIKFIYKLKLNKVRCLWRKRTLYCILDLEILIKIGIRGLLDKNRRT